MSPVEVGVPTHCVIHFNEISTDEAQTCELHLLDEKMDSSQVKLAVYQKKMTRYYNTKVRKLNFTLGGTLSSEGSFP